ncbi:hemerythrin domain-containing protein [Lacrimispora sp. JR3]|uniref:hemerythrin domain-containing protein n=1 Tax=Lacrimispora sinapis TaxID=3111456 RepID=UPI0037482613
MELKHYMEQHERIKEELNILKTLCKKPDLEQTAAEIALHINSLAGKLKIHLSFEDQYLYPSFLHSSDSRLVTMADEYQKEMGNLLAVFTGFKDKYNTKLKILSEKAFFYGEADKIIRAIETRMQKEEKGLYQQVK